MARHGRPHRSQPRRPKIVHRERPTDRLSPEQQELFQALRSGLRGDALDLLAYVSVMCEAVSEDQLPDLLESFVELDFAETTAGLRALTALRPELATPQLSEVIARRCQPMPVWLAGIEEACWEGSVTRIVDPLGDADDLVFSVRLAGGEWLTAFAMIDHNDGGVLKDGFVVPVGGAEALAHFAAVAEAEGMELLEEDAADARATIQRAIEWGAMTIPPYESETWPGARPLLSWMLTLLPEGGTASQAREWSEAEVAEIDRSFRTSSYADGLSDHAVDLLDPFLWLASSYAGNDPLRWSPVRGEVFLADLFARKVAAPTVEMWAFPDLLRAFVRFAHAERGIDRALTEETLAAITEWEPDYGEALRGGGAGASVLSDLLGFDENAWMRDRLERAVGGPERLAALTDEPLPDDSFCWDGIAEDIQVAVGAMVEWCDRCADQLFDVEHRTAMRRFVAGAACRSPAVFRRKASADRGAAAVAWVIGKANDTVARPGGVPAKELMAWFGLTGSPSQRANSLLQAWDIDPYRLFGEMELGHPEWLTAKRRAAIIARRDLLS